MAKSIKAVSLGIVSVIVIAIILIGAISIVLATTFSSSKVTSTLPNTLTTFSNEITDTICTSCTTTATSSSRMTTSSSALNYPTTAQTTNSTIGLELLLSTNSSTIESGQAIAIAASIQNTLSRFNNVSRDSNWLLSAFHENATVDAISQSNQCQQYLTYRLFTGFETLNNISSSTPLFLLPPGFPAPSCPTANNNPSWFLFYPSSYVYNETTFYGPDNVQNAKSQTTLTGYFPSNYNKTSNQIIPSPPSFTSGTYTIAAGDEWGQMVILHFTVLANSTSSSSSTTSSSSSIFSSTSQTINSTLGLELLLSVNSTTIPSEDAISVSFSVLNTLSTTNNLTASGDWEIQGLHSGACDIGEKTKGLGSPVGIAVIPGFYGTNNLSMAGVPYIWHIQPCPASSSFHPNYLSGAWDNVTSFSLLPRSDSGSLNGFYTTSSNNIVMGTQQVQLGYKATLSACNCNGNNFVDSFTSSLPGVYTLVAGDEWGQIVLLHIEVASSNNLPLVWGCSAVGYLSQWGPSTCYEGLYPVNLALSCAIAAATSSGCTEMINSYTLTIWYPYVNQTNEPPPGNCMINVKGYAESLYSYCTLVNSTSFTIEGVVWNGLNNGNIS